MPGVVTHRTISYDTLTDDIKEKVTCFQVISEMFWSMKQYKRTRFKLYPKCFGH